MSRILAPLTAIALIAGASTAFAAPWGGFYAGIQAGYMSGDVDWSFTNFATEADQDLDGAFAGAQVGYNHELGSFVVGVEADVIGGSPNGSTVCPNPVFNCETDLGITGSARARVGYAMNNYLFYATGGYALAKPTLSATLVSDGSEFASDAHFMHGWTVGGGVEYIWTPAVSVRAEYRFTDLGSDTYYPMDPDRSAVDIKHHSVNVGLNWHF
jgi:outer membrane immunogenic protein